MRITSVKFLKSATERDCSFNLKEIAMVGRSNVGKSSLINYLTNAKIAKTSNTPGRTRLINYFSINNDEFLLVDLPGYGFASTSGGMKESWGRMIEGYLFNNSNLKNILFLVDIRHKPSKDDMQMLSFMNFYAIPYTIVATKSDKLSKAQIGVQKQILAKELHVGTDNIYVVSSLNKTGKENLLSRISQFITEE